MDRSPEELPPFALAMEWVAKITLVAFEFFLPGLFGQWLDQRLGTQFLSLAGFAFGLAFGLWHLLQMTRDDPHDRSQANRNKNNKP